MRRTLPVLDMLAQNRLDVAAHAARLGRQPRVVHLIDDCSPGGVMRLLDFLARDSGLGREAEHALLPVSRRRLNMPRIEADLIVSHLSISWRGLPALTALRARHAGTPLVHVEHSYCASFVAGNVLHRMRFQTLLRTAYALFDRVVAVSEAQADWLARRELVPTERLRVIASCSDLGEMLALAPARGPVRHFGAVGRFDTQKGFDLLIRAFRALDLPGVTLTLIGDGPQRAELERLAAGDARIAFTGFSARPATQIARLDAVVMPSRWEPYGLVALEARAAGRPLLVAPVDGLCDHVAEGAIACRGHGVADWTAALAALAGPADHARIARAREAAAAAEARFRAGWAALIGEMLAAAPAGKAHCVA